MKRLCLAALTVYICYWEFSGDLAYWLPALGSIGDGRILPQTLVLAVLALLVFGSAVGLGYRALSYILD